MLVCDPQGNSVYYESTRESPVERHLYRTELKSGKTWRITNDEGIHSIMPAKSMNYFIDVFSGTKMARAYYLLDRKEQKLPL